MHFLNPLEQFEVVPVFALELPHYGFDLTVSNFTIYLAFNFFTVLLVALVATHRFALMPSRFQALVEEVYGFVLDTLRQQTGAAGLRYLVYYFLIFVFILSANLIGLIPFCFTTTSHVIMISFLALMSNLAFIFIGIRQQGLVGFLSHFIPAGAPKVLVPLISLIEVISYLMRTFSLSLRLFANMMAGHILLFILATFALKIFAAAPAGAAVYTIVMLLIMLAVYALETGICFIQAYVFLVLLSIYLNDSLAHHHDDEEKDAAH